MTTLIAVLAIHYPAWASDLLAERFYHTTAVVLTSPNHTLDRICDRQDDCLLAVFAIL